MVTLDSIEVVLYTAIFLLPGYIVSEIIQSFSPSKEVTDNVLFLKCLLFSLVNDSLFSWVYILFWNNESLNKNRAGLIAVFLAISIIGSSLLGCAIGLAKYFHVMHILFGKLKISISDSSSSAWQYKFSSLRSARWVIVTQKDGCKVAGRFGKQSMASSAYNNPDLYLQDTYSIDENNNWKRVERSDGILILSSAIDIIEFFNDDY